MHYIMVASTLSYTLHMVAGTLSYTLHMVAGTLSYTLHDGSWYIELDIT